jgi:omega-6 fatty acid desaturase (delta-12 desaturase)
MIDKNRIQTILAKYRRPDVKRSVWQLVNSFALYFISWFLMYLSLSVSVWLTLALAIPTGGLLIRIFIVFHDCGHGSFFKSSKANHFWGMVAGFFVFTPYYQWRHQHAIHHRTSGDLDNDDIGSIWTLTVEEYQNATTWTKIRYRIYRNPLILFTIGAFVYFIFVYRFPDKISNKKDRLSVYLTNLFLVGAALSMSLLIGLKEFLLIQISVMLVASTFGVWLFYLQHQFEDAYWERNDKWDRIKSALKGSSFYKLPKILQWFSGNIGFHHIHHLSPLIPNYYLEKCYKENPEFQDVKPVTLLSGFKSFSLRLYDETKGKLVSYPKKKLKNT